MLNEIEKLFFLTDIFHICKNKYPSTFCVTLLSFCSHFCLQNSQQCHPERALQHLTWTMQINWINLTFSDQLLELTLWFYLGDRFILLLHTWLTKPAVRVDELFLSYLLNLTASILAVFFSKPVHLIVLPFSSMPSHAPIDELLPWKLNRPPKPLQAWVRAAESRAAAPTCPLMRIVKRTARKFVARTGTVITSRIPWSVLLHFWHAASLKHSLPSVPFACGAESHGCRFLPVINRNALHRHRLYALGIEPTLLWSSESFCRLT